MENIEIKKILRTINNRKWCIVAIIIVFMMIGFAYSVYLKTPMYKSSSTIILVKDSESTQAQEITQSDLNLNQKLVSTYTQIFESDKVLSSVINNLGLNMSEAQLKKMIDVSAVSDTEVLKLSVINENPNTAYMVAKEITQVFTEEVKDIYHLNNVNVIDQPKLENEPYNMNLIKDIILFGIVGAAISVGFVFIMYSFDDTIKEDDDVESYIKAGALASIPLYKINEKEKINVGNGPNFDELVVFNQSKSPVSECFRSLRANILFTRPDKKIQTILVTSSMQNEGKSWISSNLAIAFAKSNKNVLIIDTDMRKGRLHQVFKLPSKPGLSNALSSINTLSVEDMAMYIRETGIPNLHVMVGGHRPPNPSELLESNKMQELLEVVKKMYDIIILDGSPSNIVSDSIVLSSNIDTTIIVAESRKTKISDVNKVKKAIESAGGNLAGVVINKVKISSKSYNSRYYYHDEERTPNEDSEENLEDKSVEDIIEQVNANSIVPEEIINEDIIEEVEEKIDENVDPEENEEKENKISSIKNYYITTDPELNRQLYKIENEVNNLKQELNQKDSKIYQEQLIGYLNSKLEKIEDGYIYALNQNKEQIDLIKEEFKNVVESLKEYNNVLTNESKQSQDLAINTTNKNIEDLKNDIEQRLLALNENQNAAKEQFENLISKVSSQTLKEEKMQEFFDLQMEEITKQYEIHQQDLIEKVEQASKKQIDENKIQSIIDDKIEELLIQYEKQESDLIEKINDIKASLKDQEALQEFVNQKMEEILEAYRMQEEGLISKIMKASNEALLLQINDKIAALEKRSVNKDETDAITEEINDLKQFVSNLEKTQTSELEKVKRYLEEYNKDSIQKIKENDISIKEEKIISYSTLKENAKKAVDKKEKSKNGKIFFKKKDKSPIKQKSDEMVFSILEPIPINEIIENSDIVWEIKKPEQVS